MFIVPNDEVAVVPDRGQDGGPTEQAFAGDTSPAASAIQLEVLRTLTGADRLRLALEMSEVARSLTLARLRRQHPDWSEADLKRELIRYAFLPGLIPAPLA